MEKNEPSTSTQDNNLRKRKRPPVIYFPDDKDDEKATVEYTPREKFDCFQNKEAEKPLLVTKDKIDTESISIATNSNTPSPPNLSVPSISNDEHESVSSDYAIHSPHDGSNERVQSPKVSSSTDTSFEDDETFNSYETLEKNLLKNKFELLKHKIQMKSDQLPAKKQQLQIQFQAKKQQLQIQFQAKKQQLQNQFQQYQIQLQNEEKHLQNQAKELELKQKIEEQKLDLKLIKQKSKLKKKWKNKSTE